MAKSKSTTQPIQNAPISWPKVKREAYQGPLELSEITIPNQIYIFDNFFSSKVCSNWVDFLSKSSFKMIESPPPKRGEATRTNYRFGIQDNAFAAILWEETGLKALWETGVVGEQTERKAVGLNGNIRIYKYPEETFFGPHYDDDFRDPMTKWKSEWTLLIYLTGMEDGLSGGGTAFYEHDSLKSKPIIVDVRRGRALVHKHGQDCMLHEGQKVLKGTKWVLRSDVMFAES